MKTEEAASELSARGVYAIWVAADLSSPLRTVLDARTSVPLGHILDAVSRAGEP